MRLEEGARVEFEVGRGTIYAIKSGGAVDAWEYSESRGELDFLAYNRAALRTVRVYGSVTRDGCGAFLISGLALKQQLARLTQLISNTVSGGEHDEDDEEQEHEGDSAHVGWRGR